MFYVYSQNNSGGSFHIDKNQGISIVVIVEADFVDEANFRAEQVGLYFDSDADCSCCGDRWSAIWPGERGDDVPSLYGKPLVDYGREDFPYGVHGWAGSEPEVYVHVKDGRFFGFILTENGQYVYDGDPSDLTLDEPLQIGE